jgi:hypothetical protein
MPLSALDGTAEGATEKVPQPAKLTSAAEARTHFERPNGTSGKDAEKLWFWVEQRFKRCVKRFDFKAGFSR